MFKHAWFMLSFTRWQHSVTLSCITQTHDVIALYCLCVLSHMILCCFFVISHFHKEATHSFLRVPEQQHVSSLQMPGGRGGGSDTSVPLSTQRLFHWRRPSLGGIRRLARTLTRPPLCPPQLHTRTYARIHTPTHNPSAANHFPFSGATRTKQQITCGP